MYLRTKFRISVGVGAIDASHTIAKPCIRSLFFFNFNVKSCKLYWTDHSACFMETIKSSDTEGEFWIAISIW